MSATDTPTPSAHAHRKQAVLGRDPHEVHRVSTPLELLFDLSFAVAFGTVGGEFAHAVATGHTALGLGAFAFTVFGTCWAWINFTWFASAYDTDDWLFRLLTMVQMAGVIVFSLGVPDVFRSIVGGEAYLDNRILVAGYIVMRVGMVGMWWRVARDSPEHRDNARTYITTILVAQSVWTVMLLPRISILHTMLLAIVPLAIELAGPILAERKKGETPWHPHHIAERYGLLVIITLGETVIGTVSAMSALVHDPKVGWSSAAITVLAAGILLTFGMWWMYFAVPWGDVLHRRRRGAFVWGYGHIPVFGAIVATGAGLHLAQYYVEGHTTLGVVGTTMSLLIPTAAFLGGLSALYYATIRSHDRLHLAMLAGSVAVFVLAVVLATSGVSLPVCLMVIAAAPWVSVIAYEALGHRHVDAAIEHVGHIGESRRPRR